MDSPYSPDAAAAGAAPFRDSDKKMEANVTSISYPDNTEEGDGIQGFGGHHQATVGTTSEPPKRLVRGPWVHTFGRLVLHAPAFIISIVLVFINASNTYWFETENNIWVSEALQLSTTNILHMLQIAAKVYELLLLLSLSVIGLGIYRKMLVTTGLPLGLITAGYRTGSLVYLKHSGLLTGLRVHYRYVLFGVFIMFTTILSVLAGPACAILVVPTPGWWLVPGRYAGIMPPITYQHTSDEIWPAVVDDSVVADDDGPFSQCSRLGALYDSRCPGYGFLDISNWAVNWALSKQPGNVTVETYRTISTIQRQIFSEVPADSAATFTTTSSSPTELVLGSYYDAVTHRDTEPKSVFHTGRTRMRTSDRESNYQPLTQSQCQAFDMDDIRGAARANNTSGYPYWPVDRIECFGDAACEVWKSLPAEERAIDRIYWDFVPETLISFSFRWVETAGGSGPLVAVFYVPYLIFPPSNNRSADDLSGVRQSRFFVTCTFAARWVPATLTAELSQTNTLQSNITSPGAFWAARRDPDRAALGKPVQLRKSWADYLDFNVTATNTTAVRAGNVDAMAGFLAAFVHCYDGDDASASLMLDCNFGHLDPSVDQATSVPRTVERVLGTSVTDGLSRVRLSHGWVQNYFDPIAVQAVSSDSISYLHLTRTYFLSPTPTPQNFTIVPNPGNATYPTVEIFYRDANNTLWEPFGDTMDAWAERLRRFKSFDLIVERNGYGLGSPSPTLTFALAIVCLYMATVLSYTLVSLGMLAYSAFQDGPGLHVGGIVGWGDIQDLVTLAWTSRSPPELSNVGAGVKFFSDTWRRVAVVRVNERGDLELVSKENGSGEIPERGKYYG